VKARGLLFQTMAGWIRKRHGFEPSEGLKHRLDAETLETLVSADKGGWYPLGRLVAALAACSELPASSPACFAEFGRYLCQVSLTTSFRGLIVFIDPVTLMKRMPLFWRRYFDAGLMRVEKVTDSGAVLSLAEPIHAPSVRRLFTGWIEHALEMVDAEDIKVSEEDCRWEVSWRWSAD